MNLIFRLITASVLANAQPVISTIPEVGAHYKLFTIEKSYHSQNIMVAYTKLDKNCKFEKSENADSALDFYWLMDGSRYKPVHPQIKQEIRKRMTTGSLTDNSLAIQIADMSDFKNDLKDPTLKVLTKKLGAECEVVSQITLGPSAKNAVLNLESIYTESKQIIAPPFHKPLSVTLKGVDARTHEKLTQTFQAK